MTNLNRKLVRELIGLLEVTAPDDVEAEVSIAQRAERRLAELTAARERFSYDVGSGVIMFADGRRERV